MEKTVSVVMDLINDQFWGGGGDTNIQTILVLS